MFGQIRLGQLNDYFKNLEERTSKGIYFYRIAAYNTEVEQFLPKYYELARKTGVVLEGKIPNPDEKNLSYYEEMMGMDYRLHLGFLAERLQKWLPRLNTYQRDVIATSIYDVLEGMRKSGKNENMQKNAYIKFMCWMYYRFERILGLLGENRVPKILYQGSISLYELDMLRILAQAGCDVVLLEYDKDEAYKKLDGDSAYSYLYEVQGAFPEGFSIQRIRETLQEKEQRMRICGEEPKLQACTNAWMEGKGLEDVLRAPALRGRDDSFFYNAFLAIYGVEDKVSYLNELYQFYRQLQAEKRKVVVINGRIESPTLDEIAEIERKNYKNAMDLIVDLSGKFGYITEPELKKYAKRAFVNVLLSMEKKEGMNIHKLSGKAIYLLCWMKRYYAKLFSGTMGCFILFGGCSSENETYFLKMLSEMPVDVLMLIPGMNEAWPYHDAEICEVHYGEILAADKFPQEMDLAMGTAAYHAERELDEIMYQDSGIYRNRQYDHADAVTLHTMYEEIKILWDQEVKYRPNFSIVGERVNLPVIFAKICGVKEDLQDYWLSIKELKTEDTFVVQKVPFLQGTDENPVKPYVTEFFKNGRLQREKIKNHKAYPYANLREEVQDYMIDKLQLMIEEKRIRGIFQNGTEYTVISTALNLPRELVRMIQNFDFTKKNPKFIYIHTSEEMASLEDAILLAYLNLLGFDVLLFVPTGYQVVEKYYNQTVMEEHQIGAYQYDLQVPDLNSSDIRPSWRKKFFKRGN